MWGRGLSGAGGTTGVCSLTHLFFTHLASLLTTAWLSPLVPSLLHILSPISVMALSSCTTPSLTMPRPFISFSLFPTSLLYPYAWLHPFLRVSIPPV